MMCQAGIKYDERASVSRNVQMGECPGKTCRVLWGCGEENMPGRAKNQMESLEAENNQATAVTGPKAGDEIQE